MKTVKQFLEERDRTIYDAVLSMGGRRGAKAAVARRFKIGKYTVTRAIKRIEEALQMEGPGE